MTLTRVLLASTAISLCGFGFTQAGPLTPARSLTDPGFTSSQAFIQVQMSVGDAEAALAAAVARLQEAQDSGVGVEAAQAAVAAAEANLEAAQAAPEPAPEQEAPPEPEQAPPEPEPAAEPEPEAAPAPEPEAAPAPEPEAAPAPEPEAAPAPEPAPEAAPEPEAEPGPEPTEQPAAEDPEPEAEPAPQPEAAPEATSEPDAALEPEPEATTEQPVEEAPVPEARPAPEAEPETPAPATEPATEQPAAEAPVPEPKPAPDAAPEAQPETPAQDADPASEPEQATEPAPETPAAETDAEQPAADPEQSAQPAGDGEAPRAPESEVLTLPVEDGAPVLDSAKEQPVAGEEPAPAASSEPAEPAPTSDAESQRASPRGEPVPQALFERGERFDDEPVREQETNVTIINQVDNRTIIEVDNRTIIEHDERERLRAGSEEVYYERLEGGRVREVVVRPNGVQLVTITNRWGDMIQRSRIMPDGREYVLFYADASSDGSRQAFVDPGRRLPPLRLQIPIEEYILDATAAEPSAYLDFLMEPPVEQVERLYTVEEVRRSARVRDKVRRIDLDSLTFEFGKATIAEDQIQRLSDVAAAMTGILEENPAETFLIEGHTDAVGTDNANLLLSDKRAETIAVALTVVFGVPPENLVTQGYGERYLKVSTEAPERLNRRVTIRRITPLVTPVASR